MMVIVEMNVIVAPSAPRKPRRLFQNPATNKTQISHSEIPRNRDAPRNPKAGYSQKIKGPWLIKGTISLAPYSNHFVYPKNKKITINDTRISS
jgi:hypothetical protein